MKNDIHFGEKQTKGSHSVIKLEIMRIGDDHECGRHSRVGHLGDGVRSNCIRLVQECYIEKQSVVRVSLGVKL